MVYNDPLSSLHTVRFTLCTDSHTVLTLLHTENCLFLKDVNFLDFFDDHL